MEDQKLKDTRSQLASNQALIEENAGLKAYITKLEDDITDFVMSVYGQNENLVKYELEKMGVRRAT